MHNGAKQLEVHSMVRQTVRFHVLLFALFFLPVCVCFSSGSAWAGLPCDPCESVPCGGTLTIEAEDWDWVQSGDVRRYLTYIFIAFLVVLALLVTR